MSLLDDSELLGALGLLEFVGASEPTAGDERVESAALEGATSPVRAALNAATVAGPSSSALPIERRTTEPASDAPQRQQPSSELLHERSESVISLGSSDGSGDDVTVTRTSSSLAPPTSDLPVARGRPVIAARQRSAVIAVPSLARAPVYALLDRPTIPHARPASKRPRSISPSPDGIELFSTFSRTHASPRRSSPVASRVQPISHRALKPTSPLRHRQPVFDPEPLDTFRERGEIQRSLSPPSIGKVRSELNAGLLGSPRRPRTTRPIDVAATPTAPDRPRRGYASAQIGRASLVPSHDVVVAFEVDAARYSMCRDAIVRADLALVDLNAQAPYEDQQTGIGQLPIDMLPIASQDAIGVALGAWD